MCSKQIRLINQFENKQKKITIILNLLKSSLKIKFLDVFDRYFKDIFKPKTDIPTNDIWNFTLKLITYFQKSENKIDIIKDLLTSCKVCTTFYNLYKKEK